MLKDYLNTQKISQVAFAKQIGITPGYLSSLLSGRKKPSLEIAAHISRETDGSVPESAWFVGSGPKTVPADDPKEDAA